MKKNKVLYEIKSLEKMILRNFIVENDLNEKTSLSVSVPTPTQMQIIEYILDHIDQQIYQKDLENILGLRRATVSGVLQTMEKNKLIERITDSEDTRTKKIILNEKAKEIFFKNTNKLNEIEKIITKNISEEDLETFSKVIEMMKNNINDNVKNNTLQKGSVKK